MARDEQMTEVHGFWFGDSINDASAIPRRMRFWFGSDDQVDAQVGQLFGALVGRARAGELEGWRKQPRSRLALVLLLDQFPRNLFRGQPAAFASDAQALAICEQSIEDGHLLTLTPIEQTFMLMPMQHAESRATQQRSVAEFEQLLARVDTTEREFFEGFVKYARMHKQIIDRFGRFPHRNAILGRSDTNEETTYLAGDAPRFGQR